ncbi:MAG: MaoC family dehydratase [Chloroflexi bacterium]|nr:MaoC family dehydratase [Chloroflexota bacterium]
MMAVTRTVETVEQLRMLVGEELGVGPWLEITQERVDAFADATGDHQFIHVDPERAAKTPFGGTIAHGYLTLSLLPMLANDREGIRLDLHPTMTVNYGLNRVRFVRPVRVGARIRLRTVLQVVDEIEPTIYQLTYQQTVEIEGGDKPALVAETLARVYL